MFRFVVIIVANLHRGILQIEEQEQAQEPPEQVLQPWDRARERAANSTRMASFASDIRLFVDTHNDICPAHLLIDRMTEHHSLANCPKYRGTCFHCGGDDRHSSSNCAARLAMPIGKCGICKLPAAVHGFTLHQKAELGNKNCPFGPWTRTLMITLLRLQNAKPVEDRIPLTWESAQFQVI